MYTLGSLFYAIYFFVSFPVYFEMEEASNRSVMSTWTLRRAATDALASGMLVTIILDLWRLFLGGIVPGSRVWGSGLVWMSLTQ